MLPEGPKTGAVKYVLFANYVTTNSALNAMSFIDVLDGLNVAQFPVDIRVFVVVCLEHAVGDFTFSIHVGAESGVISGEIGSIYIPKQLGPKTNIALPTPIVHLEKACPIMITLLADKRPFHTEPFPVNHVALVSAQDVETVSTLKGY